MSSVHALPCLLFNYNRYDVCVCVCWASENKLVMMMMHSQTVLQQVLHNLTVCCTAVRMCIFMMTTVSLFATASDIHLPIIIQ